MLRQFHSVCVCIARRTIGSEGIYNLLVLIKWNNLSRKLNVPMAIAAQKNNLQSSESHCKGIGELLV